MSPNYGEYSNRPVPELVTSDNSSFVITWNDNAPFPDNCDAVLTNTYSRPPTLYSVFIFNISGPLDGYNPMVCQIIWCIVVTISLHINIADDI